jgi:hypothetical protein
MVVSVLGIDVLGYFLLPLRLTRPFPEYKLDLPERFATASPINRYARNYFKADEKMGFDIRERATAVHTFDELTYPILSNSLGCFDDNESDSFRGKDYVYFAGDSFIWGFARYEKKIATKFEALTGVATAKCGVTHTGTRQQFDKFLSVTAKIDRFPSVVFVGFFDNDLQNDFVYPHSTVVDGWLVNTVFSEEPRTLKIVRPPLAAIREEVKRVTELRAPSPFSIKRVIKRYSLTANLAIFARNKMLAHTKALAHSETPAYADFKSTDFKSKFGYSLYKLSEEGRLPPDDDVSFNYRDRPFAKPNQNVFTAWKLHSIQNHYRLIVVMIPPKLHHDQVDRYSDMKRFLSENSIDYLDLTYEFKKRKLGIADLYWKDNEHLNEDGNVIVGMIVADYFKSLSQTP